MYSVSHYKRQVSISDQYSSLKKGRHTDDTTSIRLKLQTSFFVTSNLMTVELYAAVLDFLRFLFLDPGYNDRSRDLA